MVDETPGEGATARSTAAWDAAFRALSPRAAWLYRLLAEHPGPRLRPEAAVAVLGAGSEAAEAAVDELERRRLLEMRLDGHLHFPEPQRAHARRCAPPGDGAGEVAASRCRVVRWYRRQAERALALAGEPVPAARPAGSAVPAPDIPLADGAAARRWLGQARPSLVACVELARQQGAEADAEALAEALRDLGIATSTGWPAPRPEPGPATEPATERH